VQPVGQGRHQLETSPPQHAKTGRHVDGRGPGQGIQQAGKDAVPQPPDRRHLAVRVQAAGQHDVGLRPQQMIDQAGAELRIARAVGVHEPDQLARRRAESGLDGCSIAAILEKADLDDVGKLRALDDLLCPVRGPVVDHDHGHLGHGRLGAHQLAGGQRTLQRARDRLLFIQGGNHQHKAQCVPSLVVRAVVHGNLDASGFVLQPVSLC